MPVYQIAPRRPLDLEHGVLPFAIWITRCWRKLLFQTAILLIVIGGSIAAHAQTLQIQPNPDPWSPIQSKGKAIVYVSPDFGLTPTIMFSPRMAAEVLYLEFKGFEVEVRTGNKEAILQGLLDSRVRAVSYFGHGSGETLEGERADVWLRNARNKLQQEYAAQGLSATEIAAKLATFKFNKDIVRNHSCWSLLDNSLAKAMVKPGGSYFGSPKAVVACPIGPALNWFKQPGDQVEYQLTEYVVPEDMKSTFRGTVAWFEGTSQAEPFKGDITFTFGDDIMEGTFNVVRGNFIRSASLKGSVDSDGKIDGAIEGTAERKPDAKPLAQETKDPYGGVGRTINTFDALIIGPMSRFTFKGKLGGKIGGDVASGQFEAIGTREKGSPITIKGSWSAKSVK